MYIVADENIPYVKNAFSALGTVHTLAGRTMTAEDVKQADLLLVRSVTQVNEKLLKGSKVKFVATATIGCDHIDEEYLKQQGIGFANAPGSNATSAAEYVVAALIAMSVEKERALQDYTVGIVGCGQVGSRVAQKLQALGVRCLVNDPPRQEQGLPCDAEYVSLEELIKQANCITLHVPLEKQGDYPTYQLIGAAELQALKEKSIFINASRGDVVNEAALLSVLNQRQDIDLILDVWEQEPNINIETLQRAQFATPHIAGYSLDGKVRGVEMIYQAVCQYFNQSPIWEAQQVLPPAPLHSLQFSEAATAKYIIETAILNCYHIRDDDRRMRTLLRAENKATLFDLLRKNYPIRREFSTVTLHIPATQNHLKACLAALGFRII